MARWNHVIKNIFLPKNMIPRHFNLLFDSFEEHEIEASKNLVFAIHGKRWNDAKSIIAQNLSSLWARENWTDVTPIPEIIKERNLEMLQFIYETVRQQPQEFQEELLRNFFEEDIHGTIPLYDAIYHDDVEIFKFIVSCCPNREAILNDKNLVSRAALYSRINILEYIVRHASNGIEVLMLEDNSSILKRRELKEYFTPRKIQELGLQNELGLIAKHSFECDSLLSLIFTILYQNTEVLLFRLT